MALSVSSQVSPIATKLILQTESTSTADNDVLNAPGTVYIIDVDNVLNGAQDVYFKLWDHAGPTVGTTAPDMVCLVRAGVRRQLAVTEGVAFAVAISMATVTTGGTSGTTSPGNAVTIRILASI